jgi:hypothetical protein
VRARPAPIPRRWLRANLLDPALLEAFSVTTLEDGDPVSTFALLNVLGLLLLKVDAADWGLPGVPSQLAGPWLAVCPGDVLQDRLAARPPGFDRCMLRLARLVGLPGNPPLDPERALILQSSNRHGSMSGMLASQLTEPLPALCVAMQATRLTCKHECGA